MVATVVPLFKRTKVEVDPDFEAAQRAASERIILLSASIHSLDMGLVICNASGRVIFSNRSAQSLLNGGYQDALAAKALNEVLALAAEGNFSERSFDLFGPPKRSFLIRSRPLYPDGERHDFMATLEDVTSRRQLEEVRRDFVANVSHELKTPIGALQLLAETMEEEEDAGVLKRLAARIEKEAIRLNRIVDDLLDLSRIEAEEDVLSSAVDAEEMIKECILRVLPAAELKGVHVTEPIFDHPVEIPGDRRQLISAVYNLLDNAIKYSEERQGVRVKVSTNPEWIEIAVQDDGMGIPSHDQERIFERFYRVDQNRSRSTGGTGLGLSIVRHVIGNHKGRVSVESQEGVGSTFTLWLPLVSPEET